MKKQLSKLSKFKSLAIVAILSLILSPIPAFAEVIGEPFINTVFGSIVDTLQFVAIIGSVAFVVFSAVKAFQDQDNPQKKGAMISSIVVAFVVIMIALNADTIVTQLETLANGAN